MAWTRPPLCTPSFLTGRRVKEGIGQCRNEQRYVHTTFKLDLTCCSILGDGHADELPLELRVHQWEM